MSSSFVDFIDPYGHPDRGVDHLGMRVAGEAAYSKLIDFITTVTWRPRYFSYLCWALEQAWEVSAEDSKDGAIKVNKTLQRKILKKLDYTVAASTLVLDSSAQRIAGSITINNVLNDSDQNITVGEDHLKNSRGSYDIYIGTMRSLGLVETANNVDRPSRVGKKLAQIYQKSIGPNEKHLMSSITSKCSFSIEELQLIGETTSLSAFTKPKISDSIEVERLFLRKMLFGSAAPIYRRLSVGLILHSHIQMDGPLNLAQFRSLTLLNGLRTSEGHFALDLPDKYQSIIPLWATYQAHAYATYALESLFSIILEHAKNLESYNSEGEGIELGQLLDSIMAEIANEKESFHELLPSMKSWWQLKISSLKEILIQQIKQSFDAEFNEPDLYAMLSSGLRSIHISYLLFIFSVVRLENLISEYGAEAWVGSNDNFRLPPGILIQNFQEFTDGSDSVVNYMRYIIRQYVIKQHYQNAMRKLAATPKLDTSRFSWEGNRLVPNGSHGAGTSNPRFENAVFCLTDLGYIDKDGKVTTEGYRLLKEIEEESS